MKEYIICSRIAPSLTISDDNRIGQMITMDNIRVLECGYFALIYSSLKASEWKWIRENYPELLHITNEYGKECFRIGFDSEDGGSIHDDHVIFSDKVSGDLYPTITILLDQSITEDHAKVIMDMLGESLNHLAEMEQMAMTVLRRKDDRQRTVRNRIVRL